jgi:hypothetical protein
MKGEALWALPCIRRRTGILELEPEVSEMRGLQGSRRLPSGLAPRASETRCVPGRQAGARPLTRDTCSCARWGTTRSLSRVSPFGVRAGLRG